MVPTTTAPRRACPTCGARLDPMLALRSTGRPAIAQPFEQCRGCGTFVERPGANEWDLLSGGAKLVVLGRVARWVVYAGIAGALVHAAVAATIGREWRALESLGASVAAAIVAGSWGGARAASAIRRSRRRMGDPMYCAKLVEFQLDARTRTRGAVGNG